MIKREITMKKTIKLLSAILTVAACNTFAFAEYTSSKSATDYYTEDKPNIMVSKESPQFTIKLKSNPTTGFSWYLREYNSRLISPVKHGFEHPNTKLIGAPGYELWTFKVKPDAFVVPQQLMIKMIYARPFSTDGGTQVVFRISTQGK